MPTEKISWEKQIINAGFKAVALKVHPDKPGGSKEAMQELGIARERLKLLLNKFREWEETQQIKNTVGYQVPTYRQPRGYVYPPPDPFISLVNAVSEMFRNGERIIREAKRPAKRRRK